MRPPLLYICMPYRRGKYSTRENIARANAVGLYFAKQGYHVLVPHLMSGCDPFNRLGDDYWLACTMNAMRGCTHIVLGPDHDTSEGCATEYEEAKRLGLEIWRMEEVPNEPDH